MIKLLLFFLLIANLSCSSSSKLESGSYERKRKYHLPSEPSLPAKPDSKITFHEM